MRLSQLAWPTLSPRLVSRVLAGHSAVALALGALIYLVCLTGTLCVFIDELQLWEAPNPAPVAFNPASSDRLVAQAVALAGGPAKAPVVYLRAPTTPRQRAVVSVGPRKWAVAPSGRLTSLALPWTDFLAELHYTLTLPAPWGEMAVGLLGMGLFSLLISGVLAHPRILRDAFTLRLGGNRRLQEADLHNRLGVWGLPFHLAVTLTGALFGLANLLFMAVAMLGFHGDIGAATSVVSGSDIAPDSRPAPLPPLAQTVAESRTMLPGSQLYYIGVVAPYTRGAKTSVEVTAPGRLPRGDDAVFDSRGRLIGRTRFASGDLGLQLYSGSAEVHFGFFGGLPIRLAYGVLGLTLCWICASGTSIWLARRRDRGRPAPRLEHAWSAWIWGAPLALCLAALPTQTGTAQTFWLALIIATAGSQTPLLSSRSPVILEHLYRVLLAVALFAVMGVQLSGRMHSGTALIVEGCAMGAAVGLFMYSATMLNRTRRSGCI